MTFKNWIISTGLTETSAKKYQSAIYGSISGWAEQAGLIDTNLINVDDPEVFNRLSKSIKQLRIFQERNSVGNQMYSAALNKYLKYLEFIQHEVDYDVKQLSNDSSVSETEKESLIKARLGQGIFRKKLFEYWQGCALTRYNLSQLLVASHIKPWRNSDNHERMDVYNGLLLLPNFDKAFDKGFITFKKDGQIIVSDLLKKPEMLGIKTHLRINISNQHLQYLDYHREMVFIDSIQLIH